MNPHHSSAGSFVAKVISGVAATAAMFAMQSAGAAVIYTPTVITGDQSIYNTGTLIQANNLGGGPAVTVNGVNFGNSYSGLGGNVANFGGNLSTDPFSANLDSLLDTAVIDTVWWNSAFEYANSLTIGGLTVGRDYRLQLLMSNDGQNWASDYILEGVSYNLSNWSPNAYNLAAVWTATDNTMNLQIGLSSPVAYEGYTVLSGYALHDVTGVDPLPSGSVPLPSSLALAMLGISGLAWSRRKTSSGKTA